MNQDKVKINIISSVKLALRNKGVLLLLGLNLYFIINLFLGENSVINYFILKKQFAIKNEELSELKQQTEEVRQKVLTLTKNNVYNDHFDEILRSNLNVAKESEKIILTK